jgi:putative endonuclease
MLTQAWVYIMSSRSRCIYVGVTRDMLHRWAQHRQGDSRFVRRYRIYRLVYAEHYVRLTDAIHREKQIKGWSRSKKLALVDCANPTWDDLAEIWGWRHRVPATPQQPEARSSLRSE